MVTTKPRKKATLSTAKPARQRWANVALAVISIIAAGILVYPFLPGWRYDLGKVISLNVSAKENSNKAAAAATPAVKGNRLIIRNINIDVAIIEGKDETALNKGAWHIPGTSTPDQGGNTVISGHRFKYVPPNNETFYILDKLKKDDEIEVYWQDKKYLYQVTGTKVVNPDQISILQNTTDARLTLYTCTPLWSTAHRLVVTAVLEPPSGGNGIIGS